MTTQYNRRNIPEIRKQLVEDMGIRLFDDNNDNSTNPRAGQNRKQQVPRFMKKTGECNIRQDSKEKFERFISDFFTTMVDLNMSLFMTVFITFYMSSWVIFSYVYWLDAKLRGDIDYYAARSQLQTLQSEYNDTNFAAISDEELIRFGMKDTYLKYVRHPETYKLLLTDEEYTRKVCFQEITSYSTAFLFFVETETTVGYGTRSITSNCPEAILLLIIQCLLGTMVDAFMVGCIFIKISKPQNKNDTLVFSENAVLAIRDGKYNFMFRIGNMRNSMFVKCVCKVKFVKSKQTMEGEFLPLDQKDMDVGSATGADKLFLVTPMVLKHEINEMSPFWNLSASDVMNDQFEIIVMLEGTVESTGQSSQARTSYLNTEVLWGHRFNPILSLGSSTHEYSTDYSMFNKTHEVDMPTCSAMFFHITNSSSSTSTPQSQKHNNETTPDSKLKTRVKNIMFLKSLQAVSDTAAPTVNSDNGTVISNPQNTVSTGRNAKIQSPSMDPRAYKLHAKPSPNSRSAKLNKLLSDF